MKRQSAQNELKDFFGWRKDPNLNDTLHNNIQQPDDTAVKLPQKQQ